MGRLIDAEQYAGCRIVANREDSGVSIDEIKTVDAVPVVRCKECRSYRYFDDGEHGYRGYCLRTICVENRKETDFCSYGERRSE